MSLFPALYSPSDVTTGHGSWPPVGYLSPPVGASPNVLINGLLSHRVGDVTLPHFSALPVPPDLHSDVIATGAPNVYVNGRPIAIVGLSTLGSPVGPAGVVAGLASINVIVNAGVANQITRLLEV